MGLTLKTAPTAEPVTLAEAKLHLRVDVSDDDALISSLITAAREMAETICRRALITQTWTLYLDDWPRGPTLWLPLPPLQSVTHVKYTDDDGATATLDSGDYLVDTDGVPGRIRLKDSASWPSTTLQEVNGVAVEFDCGYGDEGADVPQSIRQAMLMMIGHWYENRELVVTSGAMPKELPFAVEALLATFRVWTFW